MADPSEINNCPACGSGNVNYMEEEDQLACNDCGELFAELPSDRGGKPGKGRC
ncbi:MAG: hypothetical protein R6U32_02010 [Candidatus Woesearchaeota archaeon]